MRARFDVESELPQRKLTQLARRNLFLAVKQAVTNAVKHSHATELTVHIKLNGSTLIVIVEDNGIGFDPQHLDPNGNGLANVTRRMQEIGGVAQIIAQPGHGSKICLKVPLKTSRFRRFFFRMPFSREPQRNEDSNVSA